MTHRLHLLASAFFPSISLLSFSPFRKFLPTFTSLRPLPPASFVLLLTLFEREKKGEKGGSSSPEGKVLTIDVAEYHLESAHPHLHHKSSTLIRKKTAHPSTQSSKLCFSFPLQKKKPIIQPTPLFIIDNFPLPPQKALS